MKKALLTLVIAFCATMTYANRSIDWSVESIVSPTVLNSNSSNQTPFAYDIIAKNNGTDNVESGDTITFQFAIIIGSNAIVFPSSTSVYIRIANKTYASGDTMHISGNITANWYVGTSTNITFSAYSGLLNRDLGGNGITPETSPGTNNNTKSSAITWFNRYGWGVHVNDVTATSLLVSPNPATDMITISPTVLSTDSKMVVTVTDVCGRIVYSGTFEGSKIELNTTEFEKGIYIIHVKNGELNSSSKVIIQ